MLSRCHHITVHAAQNLDMYLINEGKAWYLTDAGGFNSWLDPHADRIVQAVQETIPSGQSLVYVIREPYHNLIAARSVSDALFAEVERTRSATLGS